MTGSSDEAWPNPSDHNQVEIAQEGSLSKMYKADPSLENYVKLRRSNPEADIEISVVGGFDSMFYMRDELQKNGIDPDLLGGILDADTRAIQEVALGLMERMIEARGVLREGETQLVRRGRAIPDKLIDWLICCSLDALSWNDELMIPRDLIVLIRERLGGSEPHYQQVGRVRLAKSDAELIAGQLIARGEEPSLRRLGVIMNVAPSTVKRWFKPGELQQSAETWAKHFDREGRLIPLGKVGT